MNRKHFFKTLLAGIGVGVVAKKAIPKQVEEIIDASGVDLSGVTSGIYTNFRHAASLSIGKIIEVSETSNGIGYTFIPNEKFNKDWLRA